MNFMSGIDSLKHTKESTLNDLLKETRNALSDFQRTAGGGGDDAKQARETLRYAVGRLKEMVNLFSIADEPSTGMSPGEQRRT